MTIVQEHGIDFAHLPAVNSPEVGVILVHGTTQPSHVPGGQKISGLEKQHE